MVTQDKTLEDTIQTINQSLNESIGAFSDPFLYTGKGGAILFTAYMSELTKDVRYYNKALSLLEECFDEISSLNLENLNLNSLAGLGWVMQHLSNRGFLSLSRNNSAVLETIDNLIETSIRPDLETNNYDLVFGLIGKGIYFFERSLAGNNLQNHFNQIIDAIKEISISDYRGTYWIDARMSEKVQSQYINFGLAHGLPSIVSFFCMAYEQKFLKGRDLKIIEDSISFMLQSKGTNAISILSHASDTASCRRLAWCYGDLGIATTLLRASKVLNSKSLEKQALKIAIDTSNQTLNDAGVYYWKELDLFDTGFCHGLAGITHIYHKIYKFTGDKRLRETYHYWLAVLIDQLKKRETLIRLYGIEEIKRKVKANPNGAWIIENELITGNVGVGLVLLEALNIQMEGWDRIFLTHI